MKRKIKIERRKAQRICLPMEVSCVKNEKKPISNASTPRDISGTGIQLLFLEPVCKNEKMTISMYCDSRSKCFTALCEVRWRKKLDAGKYLAGLKFLKMKDRDLFNEYICESALNLLC